MKSNLWFFSGWLLLFTLLVIHLLSLGHAETFIALNPWHTRVLDAIFRALTYLGDGIFIIVLGLVLFFLKQKKRAILILASYGFSGLIVQILKYSFPAERPKLFFETHHIHYEYFLNNITLHTINSFPSGHTTSVFAMAASLAFLCKEKRWSVLFLLGAILVGYSRIYLGQHFPVDVTAGVFIGVFSASICYLIMEKYYSRRKTTN